MQTTLAKSVVFEGVGLHTGAVVRMVVRPAPAGRGIWFRRTDITAHDGLIPALWDHVEPSTLCTLLRNRAGASVSTVEHIMAALSGLGVHNALIEINGPEVPILDGSAAPFVRALFAGGFVRQDAPVRALEVLSPVSVRNGDVTASLTPARSMKIDFEIDFEDSAIGHQRKSLSLANGAFVRELAACRTFCRKSDVDKMQSNGLALGGTFDNAVVVDGASVLSPGGFRMRDEAVRHKMLDAVGDLALAGGPVLGQYVGQRAGHAMTNALLRALFARPEAWRMIDCDAATAAQLPGVGATPADLPAVA